MSKTPDKKITDFFPKSPKPDMDGPGGSSRRRLAFEESPKPLHIATFRFDGGNAYTTSQTQKKLEDIGWKKFHGLPSRYQNRFGEEDLDSKKTQLESVLDKMKKPDPGAGYKLHITRDPKAE